MNTYNWFFPKLWRSSFLVLLLGWLSMAQAQAPRLYMVQWGDTLESIAEGQGVGVYELKTANMLLDNDELIEGSILLIPDSPVETLVAEIPGGQDLSVGLEFLSLPWAPTQPVLPQVQTQPPLLPQAQVQPQPQAQRPRVVPPPALQTNIYQLGLASWYGGYFHGRLTANGERFNTYAMTAAHRFLPFNTRVRVTNLNNGRAVMVRINDRGPFIRNRIIDLSLAAARQLGFHNNGITRVRLQVMR